MSSSPAFQSRSEMGGAIGSNYYLELVLQEMPATVTILDIEGGGSVWLPPTTSWTGRGLSSTRSWSCSSTGEPERPPMVLLCPGLSEGGRTAGWSSLFSVCLPPPPTWLEIPPFKGKLGMTKEAKSSNQYIYSKVLNENSLRSQYRIGLTIKFRYYLKI